MEADTMILPDMTSEERSALEYRADTESLDGLQARRRELLKELNPLKALHGNFGIWDAKRTQMGRALMIQARQQIEARGEKPTEKYVEAEALGSEEYLAFIDRALADRVRFLELQNSVDEIEEKIRSRELEISAYTSEIRLQR